MKKNWIVFIFLSLAVVGYGQSTKKKKKKKKAKTEQAVSPRFEQQPNAYAPYSPDEEKISAPVKAAKKGKNKKSAYAQYNFTMERKVEEFAERMETNAKAEKKKQKEMKKPQYSDPSYFGHKRKPKIRKRGKRKFCKECGITH